MAREKNFLLGRGERLTRPVDVPSGGGDKNPPYTFEVARGRVAAKLHDATTALFQVPRDAAPSDEVVAVITMHPRYIAKSDFPTRLFSAVGLRAIGSRSRSITPESWGVERHPEHALTEDIFVAGKRRALGEWASDVRSWTKYHEAAEFLAHVEDISAFEAKDKVRGLPVDRKEGLLEVVLHNAGDAAIVESFVDYAEHHGGHPLVTRRRDVRGLTFIPVHAEFSRAEELARFTFVRVARGMPTLRPLPTALTRSLRTGGVTLPKDPAADPSIRVAVFDGGLPGTSRSPLRPWVTYIEPEGIGPAVPEYEDHGLAVTAALLFGPLSDGTPQAPICRIDHVRVIDQSSGSGPDTMYIDVLDRITDYLDAHANYYEFVNISLGPQMPVADDEVTAWTAALDQRWAHGKVLATVAAGNDGELDALSGLNRVQPPADAVNALAVGAATCSGSAWARASYSCVGPGRMPGVVKPDGVAFGGSESEPFTVLAARPTLSREYLQGTSFASPFVLRSGVGVRAQLGRELLPLTIKALLIQRADPGSHSRVEVGWGRFETDLERLITCDDDEGIIIYQGLLPVGQHLRAPIPLPTGSLSGHVYVTATLAIGPEVDPEHPGSYTRSGLEVSFRPHSGKFTEYENGRRSAHPKTRSFFSAAHIFAGAEFELREDGHKWEPSLRHTEKLRAASLREPCFDIYYHHRESATKAGAPQPIPYALVVGIKAPSVTDLYNRLVRTYANILIPIQPRLRIPVRTTK
jgi:hypothetical protein